MRPKDLKSKNVYCLCAYVGFLAVALDKYTFEVGGKNKKERQIKSIDNAFIIKDDIEYGFANVTPLWALGLTY